MVLMYAIGWLLKRHSSHPGTLFSTYVANRSARDRGIECQMRLVDMLLTVDDTETFAEALGSLRALTLRAYEDSIRVGPPGADERARQAADRGVGAIVPVYFNFQGPPQPVGEAKDEPAGPVTVSRTDLWESAGRPWGSVVWLYLLDDGDLVLDLDVDTMMLPESVVHTMIDVLPPLLRTMAGQVHAPVGAAAVDLPPEFAAVTRCKLIAGNWVDPETVTEILRSAPGVVTAAVADEAGEFVAQLRLAPEASWFDVHEWVLAALHHHLNAAAPTLYRIISTEEATPPIEIRPRTDAPVHPPVTMAERELAEAFRETHGFPADDLTKSYLAAGGTLLRVPALVETLRRRGYEGLRSGHFTSPGTLRSVAQALVIPPEPVTDGASY
jgi:hypothetical protein